MLCQFMISHLHRPLFLLVCKQAVLHAELVDGDEEICLGLANRSAVTFHLGYYEVNLLICN